MPCNSWPSDPLLHTWNMNLTLFLCLRFFPACCSSVFAVQIPLVISLSVSKLFFCVLHRLCRPHGADKTGVSCSASENYHWRGQMTLWEIKNKALIILTSLKLTLKHLIQEASNQVTTQHKNLVWSGLIKDQITTTWRLGSSHFECKPFVRANDSTTILFTIRTVTAVLSSLCQVRRIFDSSTNN